jgi:peroxiredoxin
MVASALSVAGCGEGGTPDAKTPAGGGGKAQVGAPAPDFAAEYVVGSGPKTLAEAKGKVVILDFWATWCGPCKQSFPKYQELVDQLNGEVTVIAVSMDEPDTKDQIGDFVKETGVKFPVLWDDGKKVAGVYDPPKMPTAFIIDKQGVIQKVHAEYHEGDEAKIAEDVKALLK